MRYANLQKGLMVSELYQLPDGWEWKKISDTFKIKSGDFLPKKTMVESGSYNVYGGNGINGKHNEYNLSGENIIIGRVGALCGNIRFLKENIWLTDNAFYVSEYLNDMDKNYLSIFLSFINLAETANQSAQPVISYKGIANIYIPFPPLEEQKRIVSKLDTLFEKIDKSISLHQKNIDEANVFMASVLNDVFVELEEKYEKKQLNEVVIFGGKNISTLEYPNLIYFSLEDVEAQTGRILNFKTANESGVKGTAVKFDGNVVLYSKLRPYLNKVIVPNLEACSTTELVVLKPKDKLDKYFLASYLRSSNIVNFLNNDSMGAKMPRTNMKTFRNLEIPFPPLQTQQKVVAYLDEISQKLEKIKQLQKDKMAHLKALKASILDQAFKGEL